MNELDLIKELAGLNDPNYREAEKVWGDEMIKNNQPEIKNQIPEPSILDFQLSSLNNKDINIENTANRLNNLLGNEFMNSVTIKRLN